MAIRAHHKYISQKKWKKAIQSVRFFYTFVKPKGKKKYGQLKTHNDVDANNKW